MPTETPLTTSFPSFVFDAVVALIEAAASEIGPTAADVGDDAQALARTPRTLATSLIAALAAIEDTAVLEALAQSLPDVEPVPGETASRRRQRENQAAFIDLARGAATSALMRRTRARSYDERTAALAARDTLTGLIDERVPTAGTDLYRALRGLRAAVVAHLTAISRELPAVVTATPASVLPSLVLAYDLYDDLDRAGEIAARNRLPRPGFVPARPIERLER